MKQHSGLSPSSLSLYMGCQRKYFHKKIVKTPIDPDASEDTLAFQLGKAYHKVLENTKHELTGLKYEEVAKVVEEFELDPKEYTPLIFAMLCNYKVVHEKSGLKATHCEVEIETDRFYGITDVILEGPDGWWIGDLKTSAPSQYSPLLLQGLPRHMQLNLYAAHKDHIAEKLKLDPEKFLGCRYRVALKSTIMQKSGESLESYVDRLKEKVKSYDVVIPKHMLSSGEMFRLHSQIFDYIEMHRHNMDPVAFPKNYDNCKAFFKPCEFYSQCHHSKFTDDLSLQIISNE